MILGMLSVDTSRKFRKNPRFCGKMQLPTSKNFETHLPKCRRPSPRQICLIIIQPIFSTKSAILAKKIIWLGKKIKSPKISQNSLI